MDKFLRPSTSTSCSTTLSDSDSLEQQNQEHEHGKKIQNPFLNMDLQV